MFSLQRLRFCALSVLSLLLAGMLPASCHAQEPISYTLKKPGKVSINIYDSKGQVVRELAHGAPRRAGKNSAVWDGRDNDGNPLAPGAYSWKLLSTPGLTAEYLMSVGSSYGVDEKGAWWAGGGAGSHGGPQAVAEDAQGFYVSAASENIEPVLIKQSWGNKRIWSARAPQAWDSGVSLAVSGDTLWMLGASGVLWNYDAKTGEEKSSIDANLQNAELSEAEKKDPKNKPEAPVAFAPDVGAAALAYSKTGLVRWLDVTGKETARVALANVSALASHDGIVYAIAGNAVYRVARDGTTRRVLDGLSSPEKIAVSADGKEFLISQGGESRQVLRFDLNGKALATYGVRGGRKDGLYDDAAKNSFRAVSDIKALPDGGFLVSEWLAAPRRVARFDHAGKLQNEWIGPQTWAPWIFPEPDNPNALWMNSQWGSMIRMVVDYKTKTWRVHSTYQFDGLANGLIGGHTNAQIWEGRLRDGQLYLCRVGTPVIVRVDRKNWKLVPVTVAIDHIQHYRNEMPSLVREWAEKNDAMLWTDKNGDGVPQREEATFYPGGGAWGGLLAIDGRMNYLEAVHDPNHKVIEFPAAPTGVPLYTDFPAGLAVANLPARLTSLEGRWGSYLARDPKSGELYGAFNSDMPGWGASKDSFLTKWKADGTPAWTVGRKGDNPGQTGVFRRILGMTHNCIALTNFSVEWAQERLPRTYVWDKDGLWVGRLFDHPQLGNGPDWRYALGAETLAGTLYTDPKSGEVLLFGHWLNEGRIYRISGWDNWERTSGTLTLKTAATASTPIIAPVAENWNEVASGSGVGLSGEYWGNPDFRGEPVLKRLDANLNFNWGVYSPQNTDPVAGQGWNGYSARWVGQVQPLQSGVYSFLMGPPGLGAIWVNGKPVYGASPEVDANPLIVLEAGRKYDIRVEYSTRGSHPSLVHGAKLMWVEPSGLYPGSTKTIPQSQLYPSAAH